ncbi:hypothetical protein BC940DRAFT_314027 [Gongronella butleri]|nr:hypothetical protein BC940DRAFT_314027 [Gongronella butleri]
MARQDDDAPHDGNDKPTNKPLSFEKSTDEICFQWCRGGTNCARYCLKRDRPDTPSPPAGENQQDKEPASAPNSSIKDMVAYYVTQPLAQYSFVVTKGTPKQPADSDVPKSQRVYNMGKAAQGTVDRAESMVKKTQQISKDIVQTWQDGKLWNTWFSDTKYKETVDVLKDRVTKMVDVARGKYDEKNVKDQEAPPSPPTSSTSPPSDNKDDKDPPPSNSS